MAIYLPKAVIQKYAEQVVPVLESGNIAEGDCRKAVESKVRDLFKDQEILTTLVSSNGTGLLAVLFYLKETQGVTDVIIQSNTMYGIKSIVNTAGLTPHVLPAPNLVMDDQALAEFLHDQTEEPSDKKFAVMYSHIGGTLGFNIAEIANVCNSYGVYLIEDCAHTLGAQDTLYGDVGVFSLYATKALPAGEGGVVFTDDELISEFVRRFIMYDRIQMEYDVGCNFRMSEVSALLASIALDHMEEIVGERVRVAKIYEAACKDLGIFTYYQDTPLSDLKYNAYKFIITDPRTMDFFKNRVVKKGEYSGNDVLTGTVFGYSLDESILAPVPHICLNTSYGVSQEVIDETLALLKQSIQ